MNLKAHFRRTLEADPERLHFAAHSHHLWPDVTFEAQQQCWQDAARLADRKWEHIFGEIYPAAQRRIAHLLGLSRPVDLAFGPNTHGFVMRLLSALPTGCPVRVLTTDGEFHSFSRQLRRLQESALARVTCVAVEPMANFSERFADALAKGSFDLVYLSQVFYDSGYAVPDLGALIDALPTTESLVAIDGYHGFLALPTDFSRLERRAFYLAGGYKYAMAGEGTAFIHAPPNYAPRPRDTGWYAAFGALESGEGNTVGYSDDGRRFLGATFDPSGLYRLNAVLQWLDEIGLGPAEIHAHVVGLQGRFIEALSALEIEALHPGQLVVPLDVAPRGNFLTFRTSAAEDISRQLLAHKVITDSRGDRLRFGFGIYHDDADIDRLVAILEHALSRPTSQAASRNS